MISRKLGVSLATIAVAACGTGVAFAAGAPKHTKITPTQTTKVKINRYIQDGLRWKDDVYSVKSGGTITITNTAPADGPHTFTVVKKGDEPRSSRAVNNCAICLKLAGPHGFDPSSNAPPKFLFLENGVGQNTPAKIDRPGDSAFVGPNKGDSVTLPVTAKKGTVLHFMCLLHP